MSDYSARIEYKTTEGILKNLSAIIISLQSALWISNIDGFEDKINIDILFITYLFFQNEAIKHAKMNGYSPNCITVAKFECSLDSIK